MNFDFEISDVLDADFEIWKVDSISRSFIHVFYS